MAAPGPGRERCADAAVVPVVPAVVTVDASVVVAVVSSGMADVVVSSAASLVVVVLSSRDAATWVSSASTVNAPIRPTVSTRAAAAMRARTSSGRLRFIVAS